MVRKKYAQNFSGLFLSGHSIVEGLVYSLTCSVIEDMNSPLKGITRGCRGDPSTIEKSGLKVPYRGPLVVAECCGKS